MVAGTVYGQRGIDLWEINSMLDGIRDQQQFGTCNKRREVLCFFSTVRAGGMADGNPYIQRWEDDNANIVTRAISRLVSRPTTLSAFLG
jgi:hypothetical protein